MLIKKLLLLFLIIPGCILSMSSENSQKPCEESSKKEKQRYYLKREKDRLQSFSHIAANIIARDVVNSASAGYPGAFTGAALGFLGLKTTWHAASYITFNPGTLIPRTLAPKWLLFPTLIFSTCLASFGSGCSAWGTSKLLHWNNLRKDELRTIDSELENLDKEN